VRGGEGGGEEEGKGREGKEKGRGGRRGEGKGLPPYAIGTPHFLDQRYAPENGKVFYTFLERVIGHALLAALMAINANAKL